MENQTQLGSNGHCFFCLNKQEMPINSSELKDVCNYLGINLGQTLGHLFKKRNPDLKRSIQQELETKKAKCTTCYECGENVEKFRTVKREMDAIIMNLVGRIQFSDENREITETYQNSMKNGDEYYKVKRLRESISHKWRQRQAENDEGLDMAAPDTDFRPEVPATDTNVVDVESVSDYEGEVDAVREPRDTPMATCSMNNMEQSTSGGSESGENPRVIFEKRFWPNLPLSTRSSASDKAGEEIVGRELLLSGGSDRPFEDNAVGSRAEQPEDNQIATCSMNMEQSTSTGSESEKNSRVIFEKRFWPNLPLSTGPRTYRTRLSTGALKMKRFAEDGTPIPAGEEGQNRGTREPAVGSTAPYTKRPGPKSHKSGKILCFDTSLLNLGNQPSCSVVLNDGVGENPDEMETADEIESEGIVDPNVDTDDNHEEVELEEEEEWEEQEEKEGLQRTIVDFQVGQVVDLEMEVSTEEESEMSHTVTVPTNNCNSIFLLAQSVGNGQIVESGDRSEYAEANPKDDRSPSEMDAETGENDNRQETEEQNQPGTSGTASSSAAQPAPLIPNDHGGAASQWDCEYCGNRLTSNKLFIQHINLCTHPDAPPPLVECPTCEKHFHSKDILKNHQQYVHVEGVTNVCVICCRIYPGVDGEAQLKQHQRNLHPEVDFNYPLQ